MGRYSSVQSYADNSQNARTTAYEQERGSGSVKTEKVVNPYSSVAGAGSGEFHVYRHSRAREQERLTRLDEIEEEETEEKEFRAKVETWKNEEEKRLEKKRKKREREKTSKIRKKNLSLSGVTLINDKQELTVEEDEFEYKPLFQQENMEDSLKDATENSDKNEIEQEKDLGQEGSSEQTDIVSNPIQASNDDKEEIER